IIFLTAKSERADMCKAWEMGADDYWTKPFADSELRNCIDWRLRWRAGFRVAGSMFPHLEEEEQDYLLQDLLHEARVKVFKKKQLIYEEGDSPVFVYFIKSGKIRTFLYDQDGRELSTGIHVDQQFFGYESVLLDQKYTDNAA